MNKKKFFGGIFLAIIGVSIWVVFCEHPWTKHFMIADGWKSTAIVLSVGFIFVAVLNIGIALVRSALSNKEEDEMKALKPWEKWLLRTLVGRVVRCATSIISVIVIPMSAVLLTIWLGESTKELLRQASGGNWLACILTSQYAIHWIFFLLVLSVLLFIKATTVGWKKGYLPEACAKEAEGILRDNPEFTDILDPLVQNAMATDNEGGLAEKVNTIREIIRLKEGLVCKRMGVEMLEDQIVKRETELRANIE